MGQMLYSGKWAVDPDTELDYIINYSMDKDEEHVSVDEVYLDMLQAAAVLAAGGGSQAVAAFQKVVHLRGRAFCPIADFMARAARKTTKSSRVFKVCLESLVSMALVPKDLETLKENTTYYPDGGFEQPALSESEDGALLWKAALKQLPVFDGGSVSDEDFQPFVGRKTRKRSRKKPAEYDDSCMEILPETLLVDSSLEEDQDLIKTELPSEDLKDEPHADDEDSGGEDEDREEEEGDLDGLNEDEGEEEGAPEKPDKKQPATHPLIRCQLCPKRLGGDVRLYSHYVTQHADQPELHPPRPSVRLMSCPQCPEVFQRKFLFVKHFRCKHPGEELPPVRRETKRERKHHCQGCTKQFITKAGLYKHCGKEHRQNPEIWPEEPLVKRGVRLFQLHERTELRCGLPQCGHTFTHFKGLVRHERNHVEAFICILCGKPCFSPENLIVHSESSHKEKSEFICRICGFYNYTDLNLKLHTVQVHMKGSKEYECPACAYKTSNHSTFQAHIRNHKVAKSYMCEECGKEFNTPQALSTHKRCHQPAETFQYQCSFCPKRFPHVSLLTIHLRVHTGEKPFQCIHCGQCFGSQSSLIKHNRNIHTPEDQMPYKCSECGKTFSKARRKVYYGHLKQHSGIRDHVCPVCKAAFSSRGYLGNHFKKVHKRRLHEVEEELNLTTEPLK